MLLAGGGQVTGQTGPAAPSTAPPGEAEHVRLFFIADVHSRHHLLDRFIEDATEQRPDLILEGGDFVHDATAAEYRRAMAVRARVTSPWRMVTGNHDAELRGPFRDPPPELPAVRAFDHAGVRFILIDNHEEVLTEEQFRLLEAELEAHAGGRVVVGMHVPPLLSDKPLGTRLRHLVPFPLASPTMREPEQVERFAGLMRHHGVLAVLAGHAHFPHDEVRDGVRYIVAGPAGGLTPGPGIANEYLDITIQDREVRLRRVALDDPPGNPLSFVARAFRFFADLNRFNHARQGWNYVPSASVQLRSGLGLIESRAGESLGLFIAASFERVLGDLGRRSLFADVGATAASHELVGHLVGGPKLRPVGSFNENFFISGAASANAGVLRGSATAGIGAGLGLGFEWRNLTAQVSRTWATNMRTTSIGLGHRF